MPNSAAPTNSPTMAIAHHTRMDVDKEGVCAKRNCVKSVYVYVMKDSRDHTVISAATPTRTVHPNAQHVLEIGCKTWMESALFASLVSQEKAGAPNARLLWALTGNVTLETALC